MKDILNTRMDAIESNLAIIEDFNILDQRRLKDLEKLVRDLKGIRTDARQGSDQLIDAKRTLNDFMEDLGPLGSRAANILNMMEAAKQAADEVDRKTTSDVAVINELIEHRLRVEESKLYKIAKDKVQAKIEEIITKIDDVRKNLREVNPDKPQEASQLWKSAWQDYWHQIYLPSREIFGDYVDLMRGLTTRDIKLDNEICKLADKLISNWGKDEISLTIPVKYVALESTVSRIIRLSYQDWSTWSLSMVAREVSYVIHSRDIAPRIIFECIYDQGSGDHQNETLLRDYLADVFATYLMGPAYAYASIYLRFDPILSAFSNGDHAPDSHRAEVIFMMLEWMDEKKEKRFGFDKVISELREDWQTFIQISDQPGDIEQQKLNQIKTWVDKLADCVHSADDGGQMYSVRQWHRSDELMTNYKNKGSFLYQKTDDVRDIMNAAWLVRRDDKERIDELDYAATLAIRELQKLEIPKPQDKPDSEDRPESIKGGEKGTLTWKDSTKATRSERRKSGTFPQQNQT